VSAPARPSGADPVVLRARRTEDVVVGDEVVRHRLASRVIHWSVALLFFLALLSGLPIWTPVLGWMAPLLGGLDVCRWLHPWAGLLFFLAMAAMFVHWLGDMRLEPQDREWLRPRKMVEYMTHEGDGAEVGKYNGGQKLFFFAVALGAAGLIVSGLVLWFPLSFPRIVSELATLLHDLTFILFVVAVILHVYLGTAAEPGTFHSMVRGTVTRRWARFHHPRWYREVTGEPPHRP
jgi:formate dehydrogenase subunit gamma